MFGGETSIRDEHRPEHELWLTMQAAHADWKQATDVLDELTASASGDTPSAEERLRLARAVEAQRVTFQEYIEARLTFSEFLLSRNSGVPLMPGAGWDSQRTASRLAILALVLALLCPPAFGLAYLMQARQHVRDLEAARDTMNAMLAQARSQVSARPPDVKAPAAPAPETGHVRPARTPRPRQQALPTAADQFGQPLHRPKYQFALTPSPRYTRIGPVKLSLHTVDRKHGSFDLSVMLGDFKFDRKHVKLYESVWINLGAGTTPVRLVGERIVGNQLQGSLGSPAPKPSRPKTAGASTRPKALAESHMSAPTTDFNP